MLEMRTRVSLFQVGQDPLPGCFGQGKVDRDRRDGSRCSFGCARCTQSKRGPARNILWLLMAEGVQEAPLAYLVPGPRAALIGGIGLPGKTKQLLMADRLEVVIADQGDQHLGLDVHSAVLRVLADHDRVQGCQLAAIPCSRSAGDGDRTGGGVGRGAGRGIDDDWYRRRDCCLGSQVITGAAHRGLCAVGINEDGGVAVDRQVAGCLCVVSLRVEGDHTSYCQTFRVEQIRPLE